jgi:hypothetical protein
MIALLAALWDKCSLLTKLLLVWALGPAFGVYMFFGWQQGFRSELLADVRADREAWAAPKIRARDEQFLSIKEDINDIKTDLRDVRNALIGPRKDSK